MKTLREMIEVMQAAERGKEIECCDHKKEWNSSPPLWDWFRCDYRVKPKPREIWLVGYCRSGAYCVYDNEREAIRAAWNDGSITKFTETSTHTVSRGG
jgi:hypothetical protein